MLLNDLISRLESLAPLEYAAEWDNVGLLVGSRRWQASSILLTIDLTPAVAAEALDSHAGLVVSYHPPIFHPLKSLTDSSPQHQALLELIGAQIAVYSPHTALDAAPGGVNDWLAEALVGDENAKGSGGDVRALEPFESLPFTEQCKIVTFCPADAVDNIRNGLASVGAGRIGNYQLCSFEITGRGTFLGGDGAEPVVGRKGTLERVDEIRLEMVCPRNALALAVVALREFHPYEEPPIEVHPLLPRPHRNIGQGRRVTLDRPAPLKPLIERIKKQLNVRSVQVALGHEAPAKYERIGLCAGAGGSLLEAAVDQGCQLFLTGEMRHHDVLAAQAKGCTIVLAGHTNTERGYLKVLRKRLLEIAADVEIEVSRRDADPLRSM